MGEAAAQCSVRDEHRVGHLPTLVRKNRSQGSFNTLVLVKLLLIAHLYLTEESCRRHRITLFEIATPPTFAAGLLGYVMAKRRPRSWLRWHIFGQGSSYIGVITAFSFQVFPRFLPESVWLTLTYWTVPTLIGGALINRTIRRWKPRITAMERGAASDLSAAGLQQHTAQQRHDT